MKKSTTDELRELVEDHATWVSLGGHPAESPLHQRAALDRLAYHEKQFNDGNQFALMDAIYQCAAHGLKMPEWVAAGYRHGYQQILNCNAKSLNEVFGDPYPKGKHLNAMKKRRNLRFTVWGMVIDILAKEPGTAINRKLFKRIGKEIRPPVGGSEAEEMYYEAKKIMGA
jgi:hypothetical protein